MTVKGPEGPYYHPAGCDCGVKCLCDGTGAKPIWYYTFEFGGKLPSALDSADKLEQERAARSQDDCT